MPSTSERKEAIRKFKERKVPAGIYAIRCAATGHAWVGASRNLGATHNGSWSALRTGGHRDRLLQEEWGAHGEAAFQYEILEQLADDVHPLAIPDTLKQKLAHWTARLGARPLIG
jgi:hypothetical protein